jgi:hypothetical protein
MPGVAVALGFFHQAPVSFLTVDARRLAAFLFVVASIKHFPRIGQFVIETDHRIFNYLGGLPASRAIWSSFPCTSGVSCTSMGRLLPFRITPKIQENAG